MKTIMTHDHDVFIRGTLTKLNFNLTNYENHKTFMNKVYN